MIKRFIAALICISPALAFAGDVNKSVFLERVSQACLLESTNESVNSTCLENAHRLTKAAINQHLNLIGSRDRTHVLNTKALALSIEKSKCAQMGLSKVVVQDCQLTQDLALLNYVEERYHDSK